MRWNEVVHARIPSLWPDGLFALLSHGLSTHSLTAFLLHWLLQFLVACGGFLCLSVLLPVRQREWVACAALGLLVLLLVLFPAYQDLVFLAGIPARHGGNWINYSLIIALFVVLIRTRLSGFWLSALRVLFMAIVSVSVFSNRLLLLQAVLPLVVITLIGHGCQGRAPQGASSRRGLWESLILVAGGGIGLISYWLAMHQCEDVGLSLDPSRLQRLAKPLVSGRIAPVVFFLALGLSALAISLPLWLRGATGSASDDWPRSPALPLTLLGLTILGNGITYVLSEVDPFDKIYWRYLLVPAFLAPLLIVLLVQAAWIAWGAKWSPVSWGAGSDTVWKVPGGLCPWPMGLGLLLTGLVALGAVSVRLVSDLSRLYAADFVAEARWIRELLRRNQLDDRVGFVADPPWESRKIDLITAGGIRSLSVSSDGNPRIYPHSRFQFLRSDFDGDPSAPRSRDVISPGWVLASPIHFDRMSAFYGKPLEALGCFRDQGCMYRFDEEKVTRNTAKFLSTWQDDLHGCLDEPARSLRARMLTLMRRLPVLRILVFPGTG